MITVVTSFSPRGYKQYGKSFIRSFRENWPDEIKLLVYYEGDGNNPNGDGGRDLLKVGACHGFLQRHHRDNMVKGIDKHPDRFWKPSAIRNGYNFRFDAYKFARKVFAVADAAREIKSGRLFWVDADVQTVAKVPVSFLNVMLPDSAVVSYLARPGRYSECGFVGYGLDNKALTFIEALERVYDKDEFFDHDEWHDAFIFDRVLDKLKPATFRIPHNSYSQPFDHSALGIYMRHFKGSRKEIAIKKANR